MEGSIRELSREMDDGREQLTLVAARLEPPRPINMLSGSTAIFGNVGSISMSSPQVESDVKALQESSAETIYDVHDLKHGQAVLMGNVEELQIGYERLEQNLSELANKIDENRVHKVLDPITQEGIDEIKKKYRQEHKMHEIHCVDNNNRIVLKEVDVNKFAVRLKINRELPTTDTFRDEARQHCAHRQSMRSDDIEISGLTDEGNRVTFIRGIAGMGKSVLAKQLTYGWASGVIYQNFKMCVMFECRDLNYFKANEGAKLEKHKILVEFLKSKVNYDLGDGEGVLFIVDGLDELFDITTKDSIIFDLLNISGKYGMAKVILTGRPHVEHSLTGYNIMGGLFKVEINGLSEDQINEYVDKFSSREDHKVDIINARTSSNSLFPIMNVPQFLNTFCCVAILMKGQAIINKTELYCWTVFLLLKQHADKYSESRRASDIFHEFSRTLSALSEVCHNLLTSNTITFEGNIKLLFGDIGEEKGFVESLFVDVSDNITEKYQFKHLSLMEFLSALYICKKDKKNLMEIIKGNLKKGFIEVVSFVCRLLSGFSGGGIIKEMLQNVVGLKQEVNEKQLLGDVIELLSECELDDRNKLSRSLEIITFFLNKNFNDKGFITSVIRKCHGSDFRSEEITTDHIFKICRHLESCGWKENDIRMAFANIQFTRINVFKIDQLDVVAVNERFRIGWGGIWLSGMTTTVNAIQGKFCGGGGNGYCGVVNIIGCELGDELTGCNSNDRQLQGLFIDSCQFKTVQSFIKACDWGISCKWFELWGLNISNEYWEMMVQMMEERHRIGDLKIKGLEIVRCTSRLSRELAWRIVQCSVKLRIDHEQVVEDLELHLCLSSGWLLDQLLHPIWQL